MKWITGILEIILGIPFLGGLIVMGFSYVPLFVMLILHIVTLALSVGEKESKYGSVIGVITSVIAWIPFVGMVMHLITGLALLISAVGSGRAYNR